MSKRSFQSELDIFNAEIRVVSKGVSYFINYME